MLRVRSSFPERGRVLFKIWQPAGPFRAEKASAETARHDPGWFRYMGCRGTYYNAITPMAGSRRHFLTNPLTIHYTSWQKTRQ